MHQRLLQKGKVFLKWLNDDDQRPSVHPSVRQKMEAPHSAVYVGAPVIMYQNSLVNSSNTIQSTRRRHLVSLYRLHSVCPHCLFSMRALLQKVDLYLNQITSLSLIFSKTNDYFDVIPGSNPSIPIKNIFKSLVFRVRIRLKGKPNLIQFQFTF